MKRKHYRQIAIYIGGQFFGLNDVHKSCKEQKAATETSFPSIPPSQIKCHFRVV